MGADGKESCLSENLELLPECVFLAGGGGGLGLGGRVSLGKAEVTG